MDAILKGKSMVQQPLNLGDSYWKPQFLGAMLISGRVFIPKNPTQMLHFTTKNYLHEVGEKWPHQKIGGNGCKEGQYSHAMEYLD